MTQLAVRPAAVAGLFYPAEAEALRAELRHSFERARAVPAGPLPKAIIAPHAGYIYSGPVAASAYSALRPARGTITTVVLLGPSHHVPLEGTAVPSVDLLATPLGHVRVAAALRRAVLALPNVIEWDEPHALEHSLEVHLPFLREVLGDVEVLPLVVGRTAPGDVADVLEAVWGGPETLIVVSSDLSHYHDQATAVSLDLATAAAIESLRAGDIGPLDACGAYPVRGLLHVAARRGLQARRVDLRTSADTAGSPDRVVGYGAFLFVGAETPGFDDDARRLLLESADLSVRSGLAGGRPPEFDLTSAAEILRQRCGAFVTLTVGGELNGCIGTLSRTEALGAAVPRLAWEAAFADPRLPALSPEDYPRLRIKISVLSPLEQLDVDSEEELLAGLRPGVDGLVIAAGGHQATFLPAVWAQLPDGREFLAHLKVKAGLSPTSWPPGTKVFRYTTEEFASD